MEAIRVAAVQMEHAPGDKDANFSKVEHFVALASEQSVHVISFPECCITGYWFLRELPRKEIELLAEPVPDGPSAQRLLDLSRNSGITIGAGLVERSAEGRLFNTYVIATPDGQVHSHRKLHCFVSEHMESGSDITVFDAPLGCRVGVLICYDNNLGENVRLNALQGVEVLLAPHQTGGCRSSDSNTMGLVDRALWERRQAEPAAIESELRGPKGRGWIVKWLPTRAYDNGLFVVFSNGVGVDGDEIRTGNAMIVDPHGNILAETCRAGDDMVVADLDPALIGVSLGRRFLRTRRPELYAPLAEPTGIEEDVHKVRFEA